MKMKSWLLVLGFITLAAAGGLLFFSQRELQPIPQGKPTPTPKIEASPSPETAEQTPAPEFEVPPEPTPHPDIRLETPQHGETVSSPLIVRGEARGTWFFEASFPVVLTNWDGEIIAEGLASTTEEWMTEDFVPFEAELEFETPELYKRGHLILQKDNPSDMRELDDAYEIIVLFE